MPRIEFDTAIGACGLAWNETGLTAFFLPGPHRGEAGAAAGTLAEAPAWILDLAARVRKHLAGELQDFRGVPLDYTAVTPFARTVYEAARAVPAGQTRTYGELAAALQEPPAASRSIGTLLGANPWPLIVPCHRILGAKGRMTGFSAPGGVRTKVRLLALEGAQLIAE